jgi:serine/threonine protein kinase
MSATKEGWLQKQSGVLKGWKKRWFSLQGTRLVYAEKQGKKELGFIDTKKIEKVESVVEGKKTLLKITVPGKSYSLSAESAKDCDDWLRVLSPKDSSAPAPVAVAERAAKKPSLDDYLVLSALGKGSFGIVQLVRSQIDRKLYAMKVMEKKLLQELKQVNQTITEKQVLFDVSHPFCVSAHVTFQTPEVVIMILDYVPGGELFTRLKEDGKFSEDRTRLYAAELALAIGHLHSHGFVYRDLKPENILVDAEGHLKITDFGLVKSQMMGATATTATFCGTPEYIAPEMLQQLPYTKSVDWWSLGILIYEMLAGIPPFYDDNTNRMYRRIIGEEMQFPANFPPQARDLISRLCDRNATARLGASENDVEDIKAHPWFAALSWERVLKRQYKPEWAPHIVNEQDTQFFDQDALDAPGAEAPAGTVLLAATQEQFTGFTCTDDSVL